MLCSAFIFFLAGLILGSFLNSLAYSLYYKLPLWRRSFCPKCKKNIKIKDLMPLLSFIFLGGKCRFCKGKISWQYFVVELATGLVFVLFFVKYGALNLFLCRDLFFALILIFLFVFDLKYYLILDKIVLPALILAIIVSLASGLGFLNLIIGILIGALFFGLQHIISKGSWVGEGDIKLGALIGAMLGWPLVILALALAYIIGGAVAVFLLASARKKFGDILPMGTFLTAAAIIVLLWGEDILRILGI